MNKYILSPAQIEQIYGCLLTLIGGCIAYLYFRVSGRLENIIPYVFQYHGGNSGAKSEDFVN